jgi:hypothetical protein
VTLLPLPLTGIFNKRLMVDIHPHLQEFCSRHIKHKPSLSPTAIRYPAGLKAAAALSHMASGSAWG